MPLPTMISSRSTDILQSLIAAAYIAFSLWYVALLARSRLRFTLPRGLINVCSAVAAAAAGVSYFVIIIWAVLEEDRPWPAQEWILTTMQGFSWLLLAVTPALLPPPRSVRVFCTGIIATAAAALAVSGLSASRSKIGFSKLVLDAAAWPISCLFATIACMKREKLDPDHSGGIYESLLSSDSHENGENACENGGNADLSRRAACGISQAGWISRHCFLWLNPLLALGKSKTLEESDMPRVPAEDESAAAFTRFRSYWGRENSLFRTLAMCYGKDFSRNAVYALMKCITVTAGPLVLKSFVDSTSEGGRSSQGYFLVMILFVGKLLESISQRQWLFGSKRLGMRMRSGVMAALCSKQLRISSLTKKVHSSGEVMSYMAVDAYRVGEFGYWVHLVWSTPLQIIIAAGILVHSVGAVPAAAGLGVIGLSMLANRPMANMQRKFQNGFMTAQDQRMKATAAILRNMKIVKLQAWEEMFNARIEELRSEEMIWLSKVQYRKTYNAFLFWLLPVLVSTSTFVVCWLTGHPLDAGNVFTTLATFRIIQEPIRLVPDMISAIVQFRVSLARISTFLREDEVDVGAVERKEISADDVAVRVHEASLSWDPEDVKDQGMPPTLRGISLTLRRGSRIAVCGEVGSGKSTLLLSVIGEVPKLHGTIELCGSVAYVAQTAWIQSGTIRENVLFGLEMDKERYATALRSCALDKDMESFPFGDLTEIGERGLNLSGGQKQRIQLARALYQDADVYLLDDPFSAVDAQTGSTLFKSCILGFLSKKTVILVTHQVEFLQSFDAILLMQNGEIHQSGSYNELLVEGSAFEALVMAHKEVMSSLDETTEGRLLQKKNSIIKAHKDKGAALDASQFNQLTKNEKTEYGDTGMTAYKDYMKQANGYLYFSISIFAYIIFVSGQMASNWWMADQVGNVKTSTGRLIGVYSAIGLTTGSCLFFRSVLIVMMGLAASKSFFSSLMKSLFSAPMSFFDSTPSGRILSRLSVDLSIIDLDIPLSFAFSVSAFISALANLGMTSSVTWQILFIVVPMMYLNRLLQVYYLASARELMRINGTTKAPILNCFGEAISGVITIRAFGKQEQLMGRILDLIDTNSSPFFHNFAAREWLIQRIENIWSGVLCVTALIMVLLPPGTIAPGFVGLVLSYGLSLNNSQIASVQNQCNLANMIISVERLKQYMSLPSEPLHEESGVSPTWPVEGRIEIFNLQVRYNPDAPLILRGISCLIEGGKKVGVVGRTGSGKTTLISALFRLVEPSGGRILIDGVDITTLGLTDLRSRLSIIPQEPTLFRGTVRFNVDPLGRYSDQEIWEALQKCQLADSVKEKPLQLDSYVGEDGDNWSVGERQLFCLGRVLLKSSQILVLDEATASIDNATDAILQRLLRSEFGNCTTITVAHRIPTVISSDVVLALEDGWLVEFDLPAKLLERKDSLFSRLVAEYYH